MPDEQPTTPADGHELEDHSHSSVHAAFELMGALRKENMAFTDQLMCLAHKAQDYEDGRANPMREDLRMLLDVVDAADQEGPVKVLADSLRQRHFPE